MASITAKELLLFNDADTLLSSNDSESELGVEGLCCMTARGFERFRLASTSVPVCIGMGRSGTGEISSCVSDFSGYGERS